MVLKGYFYVVTHLCSLLESNIFDVRAVYSMDACHIFPQGVLALVPSDRGCVWCCSDQSLHWILGGASSLLCGCHSPVGAGSVPLFLD